MSKKTLLLEGKHTTGTKTMVAVVLLLVVVVALKTLLKQEHEVLRQLDN